MRTVKSGSSQVPRDWLAARADELTTALRKLLATMAPSYVSRRYKARLAASPQLTDLDLPGLQRARSLDVLYVPLHLAVHRPGDVSRGPEEDVAASSRERASSGRAAGAGATIQDVLLRSSRIVILGGPAAGKTTLLRRLALMVARDELAPDYVRRLTFTHQDRTLDTLIPFFVSLPQFAETDEDLLSYLTDLFADHAIPQARPYLERRVDAGQCLLLLDGLDQVAGNAHRQRVLARIHAFTKRYDRPNQIVVSSRLTDDPIGLDGFECVELLPFDEDDVEHFVNRWFAEDPARGKALLAVFEASAPLRSMAANPHLLSVLAVACEMEEKPCLRSVDLLDTSIDILLGEEPRPGLRAYTRRLAYELGARRQRSFSVEEMSVVAQDANPDHAQPTEDLLAELAVETELLVRASDGSYRFAHPALADYLGAQEVLKRGETKPVLAGLGDPWRRHVVVLVAGLQRDATDLVHDLLARDQEDPEALLLAARCLREADRSDEVLRNRVWSGLFEIFDEDEPTLWSPAAVAIAALAGKRAREAFPDFLRSDDPRLRARAARALGRIRKPWGATPLIAALGDGSPQVRKEAALALGALGDERAIHPLVKLLDDQESDVCREAIRALGAIGEPALKPLIGALGDHSASVPPRAAKALSLLGETAIPALLTALGSERAELQEGAVAALADMGPPAVEPLVAALQSDNAQLRRGAVAALGRGGTRRGLRAIVAALGDPQDSVRRKAARTLVRAGSPAVPLLVSALIDPNLRVSEQVPPVLEDMGQPAVDGLLRALGDEKRALRWAAVKVLGSIGARESVVVPELRALLSDERSEVRQSAVRALARTGSEAAIEALVGAVAADDQEVREAAADALVGLGGDEVVKALRQAFDRGVDSDRVIGLAGRIGSRAAHDFLRELLEHEDRAVRNLAAFALETDETSGLYFYRAWEPRIEEYLVRRGTVTTNMLTGTPNGLRTVVLQRYVNSHAETDLTYDAEMGMLRLRTFSRSRKAIDYWNRASQNLGDEAEFSGQMFATHVAGLACELCDILDVTMTETEGRGRLHAFSLDVRSIVKGTNLPRTVPLIFLRREALSEGDLDDLRALLAKMNVYHRTALLVLFGQDDRLGDVRRLLDERLRDVHAFDVIVLGRRDVQHIVTAKDAQEALRFTICEQADLTLVSPYSFDEPASRMLFFGREFEIRTITQAIPNSSVAVLGGRRIGKTSILHRVSDLLCESHACYYMDCHPIRDYEVLFRTLAYRWPDIGSLPPEPVNFHSVVAELREDGPLILVLDEIDALLRFDIENDELLFKTFRSLSQEGQCRFIFSGERVLSNQLKYGSTSPLFNFCGQRIRLGYLERKSAEKLIVEPMGWMNIDLRDREQVVEGILDLSSCHPRLVQYICHSLIKQINQEGSRAITDQHLRRIAGSNELREEYLWTVWGDATPFERAITLAVDQVTVTQEDIQAALRRWDVPHTWEDLRTALHNLEICSILERSGGAFRFVPERFPEIARENLDVEMEISALKRRMGRERDL